MTGIEKHCKNCKHYKTFTDYRGNGIFYEFGRCCARSNSGTTILRSILDLCNDKGLKEE